MCNVIFMYVYCPNKVRPSSKYRPKRLKLTKMEIVPEMDPSFDILEKNRPKMNLYFWNDSKCNFVFVELNFGPFVVFSNFASQD